jgi:hypothetical protein
MGGKQRIIFTQYRTLFIFIAFAFILSGDKSGRQRITISIQCRARLIAFILSLEWGGKQTITI